MDQIKIGKFILNERKKCKLTQEQLAEKCGVTNKSVSRWETGKCMPDLSLFPILCDELAISVSELLEGERMEDKEKDKAMVNYLLRKKKRSILAIVIGVLIILVLILGCFFLTSYNKVAVYTLKGESKNFEIGDMQFLKSNIYNVLNSGYFEIKNDKIKEENLTGYSLEYKGNTIMEMKGFTGHYLITEPYGYDEYFTKEIGGNPDDWNVVIEYKIDGKKFKESIDLEASKVMQNDKLFYKKSAPVSLDPTSRKEEIERNEARLAEALENDEYKCQDGFQGCLKRNGNEMIYVSLLSHLRYEYKIDDDTYIVMYGIIFDENHYKSMKFFSGALEIGEKRYNFKYMLNDGSIKFEKEKPSDLKFEIEDYAEKFIEIYKTLQKYKYE